MVSGEAFDRQRARRVAQAYLAGLFPNDFTPVEAPALSAQRQD
jgi:hypothetical protein